MSSAHALLGQAYAAEYGLVGATFMTRRTYARNLYGIGGATFVSRRGEGTLWLAQPLCHRTQKASRGDPSIRTGLTPPVYHLSALGIYIWGTRNE